MPEWYTPDDYLDAARRVLGTIDLDPASSVIAQERVKAKKYYSAQQDGLSQPWSGRVFLNPPYSADLVGQFTTKLCTSYQSGDVSEAILWVNNAIETGWFQEASAAAAAVCFPTGRIKFLDEQGKPGAPLQGQAALYYGDDVDRFARAFGDVADIYVRHKISQPAELAAA